MAYHAVEQSTPSTLRTPRIYDAALQFAAGHRTNGFLVVRWVADEPRADGALLWLSEQEPVTVNFLQDYVAQNQKDAEELVLFYATLRAANAEDVWRTLSTNRISGVALSLEGKQISNRFPPREIQR